MVVRRSPLARFASVAILLAVFDLATKQLATVLIAGRTIPVLGPVHLMLVHNTASAAGIWLGRFTVPLNAATTLLALALTATVCRSLSVVDRQAPLSLGLIAGAALGNLASLMVPPAGVADFIALRYRSGQDLVFNVADCAAYIGIALCVRTMSILASAMRVQRQRARPRAPRTVRPELVVGIPLAVERGVGNDGRRPTRDGRGERREDRGTISDVRRDVRRDERLGR